MNYPIIVYTEHQAGSALDYVETSGVQELCPGSVLVGCLEGASTFVIRGVFEDWDEARKFHDSDSIQDLSGVHAPIQESLLKGWLE